MLHQCGKADTMHRRGFAAEQCRLRAQPSQQMLRIHFKTEQQKSLPAGRWC